MLDTEALLEKYYADNREAHDLLLRHSRQVRDYALALLDRRPELQGEIDRDFVAEAAMLHDIGIGQCDAPGIHCHGTHLYIEHGYLGAELLRAEGLPRHALVCERHTGMGLSREMIEERGWPLPRRDMRPVTLEEKLVCYADKFFSKSNSMNAFEGGIVAFWIYMVFFAVYGMIFWTGSRSSFVSLVILALCGALCLLS